MARFYRVLKDTPLWEEGAIISNGENADHYKPLDDLFVKDVKGLHANWYEGAQAVENQPDWFERVYPVKLIGKLKYLAKDKAKEAHRDLYK